MPAIQIFAGQSSRFLHACHDIVPIRGHAGVLHPSKSGAAGRLYRVFMNPLRGAYEIADLIVALRGEGGFHAKQLLGLQC